MRHHLILYWFDRITKLKYDLFRPVLKYEIIPCIARFYIFEKTFFISTSIKLSVTSLKFGHEKCKQK